jgi:DNA-binding transcriptional MerR regulator
MGAMNSEQGHGRRFRIGEVAALSGVTPRALRLYEARGLLGSPERTESGYRVYGAAELVRAARIRRLRALGMSLEQIAGIVADDADSGVLPDQLELLRDELRRRAALLCGAADEIALLDGTADEAAWRELLAAAERGAELDETTRQLTGDPAGPAALAALFADPGWKERWQPLAQRLRALRDADPDDPEVSELADDIAQLMPRVVLPDEVSPPHRLELFLGRSYGAAQVRCMHLARALLDDANRTKGTSK